MAPEDVVPIVATVEEVSAKMRLAASQRTQEKRAMSFRLFISDPLSEPFASEPVRVLRIHVDSAHSETKNAPGLQRKRVRLSSA